MKVAIINNLYKPYHKGGAEKVCEKLALNLKNEDHSVFIISTKPKKCLEINTDIQTYYLNSNYYNLEKKSLLYRFVWQLGNFFNFNQTKKIKKILETEKPDLVLTNNLMGIAWKTFKIIKKLNIKHHHLLHDVQLIHPSGLIIFGKENKLNSFAAKIYQKLIKKIISSPNLIISPSNWLLQEHLKRSYFPQSQTKVQKNPNPFPNIKKFNLNNNKKNKFITNFLFIGQITKSKGIIFLINTFKEIINPNIRLSIIGSGPLLEKIKLISQDDNRIKILGQKNRKEIASELQKSNCLIVPSLCYENSPTVIYEAKSFSLAIIASNLGGIPELLEPETDLLFSPKNSTDLIKKIEKFLKNNRKK